MHLPALRIALLFALAIAASVAATWTKSYLAADQPHAAHHLSDESP